MYPLSCVLNYSQPGRLFFFLIYCKNCDSEQAPWRHVHSTRKGADLQGGKGGAHIVLATFVKKPNIPIGWFSRLKLP